jgi:hypothetical protein
MDLSKYKVPDSAFRGVEIELPDSDGARFLVKLPTGANRPWQRRMLSLMVGSGAVPKPDGTVDTSAVTAERMASWQEDRLTAFLDVCVVGLPDGITREELAQEYRPALVTLFDLAQERAAAEEGEAADAEGKSLP